MDSEHAPVGTILMAALCGAAIGAGIALLYAPQSGVRTRKKLKDMAEDAEDYAREMMEKAEESIDRAERKGEKWIRKVQDFVEEKKQQVADASSGAKRAR